MAKSITSNEARKPKPDKPYAGFPLFPHASGRWAKKVRQKTHFFGRWGNTVLGEVVPVDDIDASARVALGELNRQWPYLSEGRTAPPVGVEGCTIRSLCNLFLTEKQSRIANGELTQYSFNEYHRIAESVVSFFGRDRIVDDLRPDDFSTFRNALGKGCGVVTLKSKINRARVLFKFASDRQLIDRPVAYGGAFDRPKDKALRQARHAAGERLFERDQLLSILNALDGKPIMRAMVLTALNTGFGNTDIATLPRLAVNLETGWIVFPRPKTGIYRKVPLWPETIDAMRKAFKERPTPRDAADADLCFLTNRGTRYVRLQPSTTEGKFVTVNSLSRRFETTLKKLGITGRRGLNFYTLRHVFETQAGESKDQIAVDSIMGHADPSMGAQYRERISDQRLVAVTEHVRKWLFSK